MFEVNLVKYKELQKIIKMQEIFHSLYLPISKKLIWGEGA